MGEYYIVKKNGQVIAQVRTWKEMRSKIPGTHAEHKGDVYDFIGISENKTSIQIFSGKGVYNSYCVRYECRSQRHMS